MKMSTLVSWVKILHVPLYLLRKWGTFFSFCSLFSSWYFLKLTHLFFLLILCSGHEVWNNFCLHIERVERSLLEDINRYNDDTGYNNVHELRAATANENNNSNEDNCVAVWPLTSDSMSRIIKDKGLPWMP